MFLYHTLRPLQLKEEIIILETLIRGSLPSTMHKVIDLAQRLRNSNDVTLTNLSSSLSTRQLLRIARRLKVIRSNLLNNINISLIIISHRNIQPVMCMTLWREPVCPDSSRV